jgi:hypothetical protein
VTSLSGRRALTGPDRQEPQAAPVPAASDAEAGAAADWLLERSQMLPPRLRGALEAWRAGLGVECESMADIPSLRGLQYREIAGSLPRVEVLLACPGLPRKLWWGLETWQADLRAEAESRPEACQRAEAQECRR